MQNIVAAQMTGNEYLPRNNVRKEMLAIKARIFKDAKTMVKMAEILKSGKRFFEELRLLQLLNLMNTDIDL